MLVALLRAWLLEFAALRVRSKEFKGVHGEWLNHEHFRTVPSW